MGMGSAFERNKSKNIARAPSNHNPNTTEILQRSESHQRGLYFMRSFGRVSGFESIRTNIHTTTQIHNKNYPSDPTQKQKPKALKQARQSRTRQTSPQIVSTNGPNGSKMELKQSQSGPRRPSKEKAAEVTLKATKRSPQAAQEYSEIIIIDSGCLFLVTSSKQWFVANCFVLDLNNQKVPDPGNQAKTPYKYEKRKSHLFVQNKFVSQRLTNNHTLWDHKSFLESKKRERRAFRNGAGKNIEKHPQGKSTNLPPRPIPSPPSSKPTHFASLEINIKPPSLQKRFPSSANLIYKKPTYNNQYTPWESVEMR